MARERYLLMNLLKDLPGCLLEHMDEICKLFMALVHSSPVAAVAVGSELGELLLSEKTGARNHDRDPS